MKAVLQIAIAASLAAGVTAQPHHQHRHQHARRHQNASPLLSERALEVEYAFTTETEYVNVADGSHIDTSAAEEGIADGIYKVVGETTPTSTTPTPTPTPTPSTSTSTSSSSVVSSSSAASTSDGGAFLELKLGLGSTSTSSSSSAAVATASSSSSSSSSSGATGVDADFPDGELDCSTFPSDYGAVELSNAGYTGGWAALMDVGTSNYVLGQSADITVDISMPDTSVQAGYFAMYGCPAGYDPAQWPEAQGSKGQSIGGLWCGTDNKLYLTRSSETTKLCQAGAGNVKVTNNLSEDVYLCKTLYPGSESMVLPTLVGAGETVDLYNPYQDKSYVWQGGSTSAQYYVNKKGLGVDQACVWTSPAPNSESAGNWAPECIGTSVNADGETFLSMFHNTPTSSAALDFDMEISGSAVSGDCKYSASSDSFTGGGNGCTVSLNRVIIRDQLELKMGN